MLKFFARYYFHNNTLRTNDIVGSNRTEATFDYRTAYQENPKVL